MSAAQLPLFEPTGAEVGALAVQHANRAQKAHSLADVCDAHGWEAIAAHYRQQARQELNEAECLAMLAEFERLGGVVS